MRTHLDSRKETFGVESSHGQKVWYRSRELVLGDMVLHEIAQLLPSIRPEFLIRWRSRDLGSRRSVIAIL